ncbi:DMT family transporter [Sandaracinobacteroides hominis]|uniref:DMT family transporter n=1 Tax=Sandaracinobacteroides hominis TaxID=2780086 RepID=UPI0018F2BFAA|nr:DMT family transporter [Sandaracinobacteroides hominis]
MASVSDMQPASRWPLAALLLGSALLAFGPLLVRLADVSPASSAFWRMALAAPVLILIAVWQRRDGGGVPLRALPWAAGLAAGFFFAADLVSWHFGIVRTTSANATLFGNSTAFMLAGWAILVRGDTPKRSTLQALALAGAGTALLLGNSAQVSSQHLAGDLLSLLAAAFYTGYIFTIIRMRDRLPTVTVLGMTTLVSAVMLLPVALLAPGSFWPGNWTPVLALALTSQLLGQGLMTYASGKLPAPVIGIGLLVQPMVSAAAGWVVLNEALGPVELLGAAMVAAALVLVRR